MRNSLPQAYIRSGTSSFKNSLPYTPGQDAAGTVEAVGEVCGLLGVLCFFFFFFFSDGVGLFSSTYRFPLVSPSYETAQGVTKFKTGDRVYTSGTLTGAYAQFTLSDANKVHSLPESISFDAGAGINVPYKTTVFSFKVR